MTDSNRNRHGKKGNDKETRTDNTNPEKNNYRKLPDNPQNKSDKSVSTADDTANGIYSRTKVRDEDVDNEDTRGGR